jgi:hypothetical protein
MALIKAEKRHRATGALDEDQLEDQSDLPEEAWNNKELNSKVRRALDQLTPLQKDVLMLRYYAELEPIEIAALLEIPDGTVRKRLHDASMALALVLGSREPSRDPQEAGAESDAIVQHLLAEDRKRAQLHGARPEASIALALGAALIDMKGLSPLAQQRARSFVEAARTKNASALMPQGVANSALYILANRPLVALLSVAASAALVAGGATAFFQAQHRTLPAAHTTTTPVQRQPKAAASVEATEQAEATPTARQATTQDNSGASQQAPSPPTPTEEPVVRPTLTVTRSTLSYPVGAPVTAAQLLKDSGAQAADSHGQTLPVELSAYDSIDFSRPGVALVFLRAHDSAGVKTMTAVLRVEIVIP